MSKSRRAHRTYVQRKDHEHIWTVSVFDSTDFGPSPSFDNLQLLSPSQWIRQDAGLERATILRTVVFLNTIFTYTAASDAAGPPDFNWVLILTDDDDSSVDGPNAAPVYSEDVMRFGIANHAVRFAAANACNIAEVAPSLVIDTNVKRRIHTNSAVQLRIDWNGAGGIQEGAYRCVTRCLIKLA